MICGWYEIRCFESNNCGNDNIDIVEYFKRCRSCGPICKQTGYDTLDYCATQGSGQVWLGCGLLSTFVLFAVIGMMVSRLWVDTKRKCNGLYNVIPIMIETFTAFFLIIAILVWVIDNPVCWSSDLIENNDIILGQSPYWIIIAIITTLASAWLYVEK